MTASSYPRRDRLRHAFNSDPINTPAQPASDDGAAIGCSCLTLPSSREGHYTLLLAEGLQIQSAEWNVARFSQ
ncbi:hypothetical protein NQZ68_005766 [Dissostichus eleginoides]|nr:hypothetical protein NQZ68_005766 [Dissostichus eleginoides]